MKNDFGGHDNHQFGNVYAYTGQVLGVDNTLPGHEDQLFDSLAVITGTNVGGPICGGPAPTQMGRNQYFTHTGNITVCGKSLAEAQQRLGIDLLSNVSMTPPDEVIFKWARELLQMPSVVE